MGESFGRLLQRYRVAAGLSQEMLAERAGISTNAISALERGLRHAPHSATLDLLIAALKLDNDARLEVEEAAKLARAHRIQAQQREPQGDIAGEALLNNLPPELTSFVDRETETAEIKALVHSHGLVTVIGTGGAGKTRCAIKIAGDMLGCFVDGVWVADLTAIFDPALVSTVIARALKVQETPNRPLLETLLAYLRRKRMLVILDNCEHVIGEVSRVAAAILRNCPDVRILATSREGLSIAGEQVYRMPSLPVPSTLELLSASEMSGYGAVRLFSDRACSADNRFTLSVESAPHVADICRRLDGIPLAIELAAARVTTLSPRELAKKLDERFRLLTGGDRDTLPRHRTMRALIDWSYDLLSGDERELFRKLSIFAGGFTLDTVAAVCAEGERDEIVIVDLLSSLVGKSLVQVDMLGSDTRYRLLESTRQYAREKLRGAGEEDTIAYAHARAFLELADQLCDAWETTPDRAWHAQVDLELENFRAALFWAFSPSGDVLLGQRLVGELRRVWFSFGPAEGLRWAQVARQRITPETPTAVLAALDLAESAFAQFLNQHKASLALAERALARYRDLADSHGTALAQLQIGVALVFLGKIAEAEALTGYVLQAARARGACKSAILAQQHFALMRYFSGDLHGARQGFREALAAARTVGAERWAANFAMNLAEVEFRDGDATEALRLANESLEAARGSGEILWVAYAWPNMAAYLVALRRFDEARAAARGAVTAACNAQYSIGLAWSLQHLAAVAALRPSTDAPVIEDRHRAACILGYVDARLVAHEALRQYTDQKEYDAVIPALRDSLGDDELARLMADGSAWSEDRAIAEAMSI